MAGYYEPCEEFDICNRLIEKYWESRQFELCFQGYLKLAEETSYPLAECQVGYFYFRRHWCCKRFRTGVLLD